jgi:hypothetical protein
LLSFGFGSEARDGKVEDMKTLFFIRGVSTHEGWDYFESHTGVWIFGDVAGYRCFRQSVLKAIGATRNIHLTLLEKNPESMRGVILPAKQGGARKPRLKFIERLVEDKQRPNMELVIYGNPAGYHYLADNIETAINEYVNDTCEHIHLDCFADPHVVRPGADLNLRGPLRKWGPNNFGGCEQGIYAKNPHFLPRGLPGVGDAVQPEKDNAMTTERPAVGFVSHGSDLGPEGYREIVAEKCPILKI